MVLGLACAACPAPPATTPRGRPDRLANKAPASAPVVWPPFHCRPPARPEPKPVVLPAYEMKPGKLEVRCRLDKVAKPPTVVKYRRLHRWTAGVALKQMYKKARLAVLARTRCRMLADRVRLGDLAGALAKQTGVPVTVAAPLAGVRVALSVRDAHLEVLLRDIADAYDVGYEAANGDVMLWQSPVELDRRLRRKHLSMMMLKPTEIRVFPIASGPAARQLAAAYCAFLGSPRGRVTLTGNGLLISDLRSNLDLAEQLVKNTDDAPPGAMVHACTPGELNVWKSRPIPAAPKRPGKLELTCSRSRGPVDLISLNRRRCSKVTAQGVTAGALGVALAEAMGQDVVVEAWAVGAPVWVTVKEGTAGQVLGALKEAAVRPWLTNGVLLLTSERGRRAMGQPFGHHRTKTKTETRLIPVKDVTVIPHLAEASCRHLLSRPGAGAAGRGRDPRGQGPPPHAVLGGAPGRGGGGDRRQENQARQEGALNAFLGYH